MKLTIIELTNYQNWFILALIPVGDTKVESVIGWQWTNNKVVKG